MNICSPDKETELEKENSNKLLGDDEVPFSEAINPALFSSMHSHCDLSCLRTCSCDLAPCAQARVDGSTN